MKRRLAFLIILLLLVKFVAITPLCLCYLSLHESGTAHFHFHAKESQHHFPNDIDAGGFPRNLNRYEWVTAHFHSKESQHHHPFSSDNEDATDSQSLCAHSVNDFDVTDLTTQEHFLRSNFFSIFSGQDFNFLGIEPFSVTASIHDPPPDKPPEYLSG